MCTFYDYTNRRRTQSDRAANAIRSDGERNPIGRRTQSDWTADAIRLDGGRNPIEHSNNL